MSIGHSLHHRLLGATNGAPPLILLHGLMGFAANWGKVWPDFENERPVLVMDQRGHGRSPKPETGYSPTDYAQDLHELVNELNLAPFHLVGHSMGGRVALRFASLYPELVKTLTMEDSGVVARPERSDWIGALLKEIPTPFADRNSAKIFFDQKFQARMLMGTFLFSNLETKADGTLDWRFQKDGMLETIREGRALDASEEFRKIQAPILLIRGALSIEFRREEAEEMLALNANAQLVEIPRAGHFVHAEQPRAFNQSLKEFLSLHS
jgi:esterase